MSFTFKIKYQQYKTTLWNKRGLLVHMMDSYYYIELYINKLSK